MLFHRQPWVHICNTVDYILLLPHWGHFVQLQYVMLFVVCKDRNTKKNFLVKWFNLAIIYLLGWYFMKTTMLVDEWSSWTLSGHIYFSSTVVPLWRSTLKCYCYCSTIFEIFFFFLFPFLNPGCALVGWDWSLEETACLQYFWINQWANVIKVEILLFSPFVFVAKLAVCGIWCNPWRNLWTFSQRVLEKLDELKKLLCLKQGTCRCLIIILRHFFWIGSGFGCPG